jgi:anti-anti-sigma factor
VADNNGGLSLAVAQERTSARVAAAGEIDIHTCAELEETLVRLVDAGVSKITLDLSEVAFIDSSGLRSLLDAQIQAYRQNRAGALKLLAVGESRRNPRLDVAELAAHTTVASVILNLDETITKQ